MNRKLKEPNKKVIKFCSSKPFGLTIGYIFLICRHADLCVFYVNETMKHYFTPSYGFRVKSLK